MARETQGSPASEKKLEQYGVWVKVKPREVLESAATEDSVELSDLETPKPTLRQKSATEESTLTADEEKLLDDLDMKMGPQDAASNMLVPDEEPLLEEADLPDIELESTVGSTELADEELPELDDAPVEPRPAPRSAQRRNAPAETEVEVTLSDEAVPEDHFDDLAALESELATTASTARVAAGSSASSTQILARIEEELKSIRTDLTQLRTELSGLRSKAGAETAADGAGRAESQSGFFDEEEDETIALTGDELDNILNSADITEEAAEASTADTEAVGLVDLTSVDLTSVDMPSGDLPPDDILSYETPVLEEDALPLMEEIQEQAGPSTEIDDTLVLTDDALLPDDEEGAEPVEELPSELVLEDLRSPGSGAGKPAADSVDELAEVDLEAIPELESVELLMPASGPEGPSLDDLGDETIDLETLDLGEEPKVIDAVAEQVEDLETVEDAEAVLDEELTPEIQTDDVDLEALAAEAEELEGTPVSAVSTDDLDIGELESVPDEPETAPSAAEEIEIPFEAEVPTPSPEVDAELEQILDAEEVGDDEITPSKSPAAAPAASAKQGDAIPDNLKEEIRTVLKYMDNLLEALPDEKIQEFAKSDYFVMYKKLFEDLGLGE